jgi:hypothetical protein
LHFYFYISHFEGIWNLAPGFELVGGFILGAEASGADVDFSFSSLYHNRSPLDIRQPLSRGMLLGMAYTTTKGSSFTTNFALHRNFFFLLNHPVNFNKFA